MWPGLVGKGNPGQEASISLTTMLNLTAGAEHNGGRFDAVDLFLHAPHTSIDAGKAELEELAGLLVARKLSAHTLVAPGWFFGNAMGSDAEQDGWLSAIERACIIGEALTNLGVRSGDMIRIDSGASPIKFIEDSAENRRRIVATFARASSIAKRYGQRLTAETEMCWGGMSSPESTAELLGAVSAKTGISSANEPGFVGALVDLAHILTSMIDLSVTGSGLQPGFGRDEVLAAMKRGAQSVGHWTIDYHAAQNDGKWTPGDASHPPTGKHCAVNDTAGLINIVEVTGIWAPHLRGNDVDGICWDGCQLPNETLLMPNYYNEILTVEMAIEERYFAQ